MKRFIKFSHRREAQIVCRADDDPVRPDEILPRDTFAQKFRIIGQADVAANGTPGLGKQRHNLARRRARRHRGFDDQHRLAPARQRFERVRNGALQIGNIRRAALALRRTHAIKNHVGIGDGFQQAVADKKLLTEQRVQLLWQVGFVKE